MRVGFVEARREVNRQGEVLGLTRRARGPQQRLGRERILRAEFGERREARDRLAPIAPVVGELRHPEERQSLDAVVLRTGDEITRTRKRLVVAPQAVEAENLKIRHALPPVGILAGDVREDAVRLVELVVPKGRAPLLLACPQGNRSAQANGRLGVGVSLDDRAVASHRLLATTQGRESLALLEEKTRRFGSVFRECQRLFKRRQRLGGAVEGKERLAAKLVDIHALGGGRPNLRHLGQRPKSLLETTLRLLLNGHRHIGVGRARRVGVVGDGQANEFLPFLPRLRLGEKENSQAQGDLPFQGRRGDSLRKRTQRGRVAHVHRGERTRTVARVRHRKDILPQFPRPVLVAQAQTQIGLQHPRLGLAGLRPRLAQGADRRLEVAVAHGAVIRKGNVG